MLQDAGAAFTYREYTEEPLDLAELEALFRKLGRRPSELLRTRDAEALGLTGDESDHELLALMAAHPTLLQRPIGVVGDRALVGRPPEELLGLL